MGRKLGRDAQKIIDRPARGHFRKRPSKLHRPRPDAPGHKAQARRGVSHVAGGLPQTSLGAGSRQAPSFMPGKRTVVRYAAGSRGKSRETRDPKHLTLPVSEKSPVGCLGRCSEMLGYPIQVEVSRHFKLRRRHCRRHHKLIPPIFEDRGGRIRHPKRLRSVAAVSPHQIFRLRGSIGPETDDFDKLGCGVAGAKLRYRAAGSVGHFGEVLARFHFSRHLAHFFSRRRDQKFPAFSP